VFGRRHRSQAAAQSPSPAEEPRIAGEPVAGPGMMSGPYDAGAQPDDGRMRLDLGSLRLPLPEGAQLQVEVDRSGPVRAVHLITGLGQITLNAFAAPRSGGLWREVVPELLTKLRADGARVGQAAGEWGEEIEAMTDQGVLVFLGVDGPRWMLRGVAAGPSEGTQARIELLREVVRHTVVVRGVEPLPVGSPLPLRLSDSLAEQLRQATAELVDAAVGDGAAASS
jgi:Protein of unknown function (DUF3710)